jgi:hypothetical protein
VKRIHTIALIAATAAAATACASGPRTPDEFRVVRKAPLTVPPDYSLRPPAPGEARPQELSPDVQARVAVFGADYGKEASDAEKTFVKQIGGDAVDRTVRAEVDYDSSQIVRKNRSFADAILSFGKKGSSDQLVDASAEAERIKAQEAALADVTGNKPVIIQRKRSGKLPGL